MKSWIQLPYDNLQAALGVAQLERLPEFVSRKRAMEDAIPNACRRSGLAVASCSFCLCRDIIGYTSRLKDEIPFDAAEPCGSLPS